jgi:hypothetical protein
VDATYAGQLDATIRFFQAFAQGFAKFLVLFEENRIHQFLLRWAGIGWHNFESFWSQKSVVVLALSFPWMIRWYSTGVFQHVQ